MSKKVTIYGDTVSQPVRALICFCEMAKIDYEFQKIDIFKGEQYSKEYKKINPNGQVPSMQDYDGFTLFESHAIFKYLCATRNYEGPLYPTDPKERSLIDQYLDWHHLNIRDGVGGNIYR
jgi:glutathione S-transferase